MDSFSRVLDIPTLNRIVNEAVSELFNSNPYNYKRVIIYYVDMADRAKIDEFVLNNNKTPIEIEFRDLKELLNHIVLQDEVEYKIEETMGTMFGGYTVSITKFYSDRVSKKIAEFNQNAMANSKKQFTPLEMSLEGLEAIEMVSLDCTTAELSAPWHSDAEIKIERNSCVTRNGIKLTDFWDGKIHSDEKPLRMKVRNICGDETIVKL
jgi:adenine-specific DNA-methyltransferase